LGSLPAAAQQPGPADQTPALVAAPDIVIRGDLIQRQLLIGGRVVFEKAGSYLGRPTISPDGRMLAISVTPTGAETAAYSQVRLYALPGGALLSTIPGHSPVWQADRRGLALQGPGGRLVYDTSSGRTIVEPAETGRQSTIPANPVGQNGVPDYPQFIRVAHHPQNTYRHVPDWQVDVIPFEEYVARSLPAEVPASWGLDALAAQAIATRTYAWYQILQNRATYDVTDWADFQMMCDQRYPASDQATTMTAGQYLSYQGDSNHAPIIAMYSARNGHPTLDNPAVPYLRAVPDPTGLGEERWGHGYGLSQWGAARRAELGQSYRQILGHYYTAVDLQNALDPSQPIAGLLGPTPQGYLPPGGLRWNTLAPFTPLPVRLVVSSPGGLTRTLSITTTQIISYTDVITHSGGLTETVTLTQTAPLTQTTVVTEPVTLPGSGVWPQHLHLADGMDVQTALYVSDTLQEIVSLRVDRTPPPAPTLELPNATGNQTITVRTVSAADSTIGLSNDWRWEGERLLHSEQSGSVVADPAAANGTALEARPGRHTPGDWYGPYTTVIPPGATYRALFRLRAGEHPARTADGVLPDRPIARLDVADQGGTVRLGLRDIWTSDFAAPDRYQEIAVDFHVFEPTQGLEFRVKWYGSVTLALDRVWVWQLQDGAGDRSRLWRLRPGMAASVQAITFDAAANASPFVSDTVQVIDDSPPIFGPLSAPQGWQTALPITLTTTATDWASGLDTSTAEFHLRGQSRPVALNHPDKPWAEQRLMAVLDDEQGVMADGVYAVGFRVSDRAGHVQNSPRLAVKLDRTPPDVSAGATLTSGVPISSPHGWFGAPVLVQIDAADATSGVAGVAYVVDDAPFVMYSRPFTLTTDGWHVVRYWAQDVAGNYRYSQFFTAGIDMTAPTVWARVVMSQATQALVTWGGDDNLSGVTGFRVEIRRDGGDWQPLLPLGEDLTAETSLPVALVEGETVEVRVQAMDRVGNRSPWTQVALVPRRQIFLPAVSNKP